jgi:hypothetical protein
MSALGRKPRWECCWTNNIRLVHPAYQSSLRDRGSGSQQQDGSTYTCSMDVALARLLSRICSAVNPRPQMLHRQ